MTVALPRPTDTALLVSKAALQRMQAQLEQLRAQRPAMLASITAGWTGGDAADQAGYVEQIEILDDLDARIERLATRIANAVVTDAVVGTGRVEVGAVVTVRFAGETAEEAYLVGTADMIDGEDVTAVSPQSPMGRALLGAGPGDVVTFAAPRGTQQLTVVTC